LMLMVAYSVAATLLLVLSLWLIRRAFKWWQNRIEIERGRLVRAIRFQMVEVFSEERLAGLLLVTASIIKFTAYLILLDLYLTTVLGFFPWTRGFSERLTGYVLAPLHLCGQALIDFLPNLFSIAVALFITFVVLRVIRFLFNEVGKGTISFPGFHPDWAAPTFNILRFLVIAFAVVVIFPYLPGSDSPAFRGVSVFLGVLFSFGSSSAVSNIVSGIILTYTRAFNLGDWVRIGDAVGDVIEKSLLVTRIRTIKNVDITVPNSMVLNSHVINYSASLKGQGLILHTSVTIGYDAPWRQVHELLKDAATRTTNVLKEPAPFVLQTSLDDFYVSYQINVYTDQPNRMAVIYSELHQHIQDCFNEAGVEIMSPHYATLRDGNAITIPSGYLPEDYRPQSFRIHSSESG